jgi:hypothetical protein
VRVYAIRRAHQPPHSAAPVGKRLAHETKHQVLAYSIFSASKVISKILQPPNAFQEAAAVGVSKVLGIYFIFLYIKMYLMFRRKLLFKKVCA